MYQYCTGIDMDMTAFMKASYGEDGQVTEMCLAAGVQFPLRFGAEEDQTGIQIQTRGWRPHRTVWRHRARHCCPW